MVTANHTSNSENNSPATAFSGIKYADLCCSGAGIIALLTVLRRQNLEIAQQLKVAFLLAGRPTPPLDFLHRGAERSRAPGHSPSPKIFPKPAELSEKFPREFRVRDWPTGTSADEGGAAISSWCQDRHRTCSEIGTTVGWQVSRL